MSKITYEAKKDRIIIVNRLSYPEAVNERVHNAILSGMFEGLLPVSINQKRKEIRLECVVQGMIPLTQYFSGFVTQKMFLDFVHEIAVQIKNCEKNMINLNNLDLHRDLVFIDPQTKRVKCIFWPVVNNQRGRPPHLFLKQLPFEFRFNPLDSGYLEAYKAFFSGVNPFSVNSFDRMVLTLSGKKIPGEYATPSEALSGTLHSPVMPDRKNIVPSQNASIEYDPFAAPAEPVNTARSQPVPAHNVKGNMCPTCGTGNLISANFCCKCGQKLMQDELEKEEILQTNDAVEYGTTVLGDDFGETTVLGYDEPEQPVYPVLVRLRTEEAFTVDKPNFRIGTERRYCDLFICDNTYISRSHADIITRDDRYYIVDRNSTNKTYVDGKVIPVEKEVEIFAGTQIRLADEDFTFNIET